MRFRDSLERVLGKYCPDTMTLNNLSTYLYRLAVDISEDKDVNTEDIYLSKLNEETFIQSLKNLSVFMSQNIMIEVLKDTYSKVRNIIPVQERNSEVNEVVSSGRVRNYKRVESNVGEFDIDIDSIPKVKISSKKDESRDEEKKYRTRYKGVNSNVFSGDVTFDYDEINQRTPEVRKRNKNTEEREDKSDDASKYTEEVYKSTPDVNIGLDY